jgi:hypothetical protein
MHAVTDGPGFGQPLPVDLIQIGHRGDQLGMEDQGLGEWFGLADASVGDLPHQVDMPGQPGVGSPDRCENTPGQRQDDQAVLKLEDHRPRHPRQID